MFPPTSPIPVVIVAPPGRLRDALSVLLRADNRIALVGEAEDVTSGLQLLAESVPALVVLNVSEGGATALVGLCELKTHYPQVRFVALVRDHAQEQQAHVADIDAVRANGFTSEMLFRSPR